MGKPAVGIELTAAERGELESLAGRHKTAQGLARAGSGAPSNKPEAKG